MRRTIPILAAAGAILTPATAIAQQPAAPAPCLAAADSSRADTASAGHADVLIRASATIAELRFETQPQASARVTGCDAIGAVRVVERRNLPERVQPGVTYRDVTIAVEIVGRLEAACIAALATDPGGAGTACAPVSADTARAPPRP